MKKAGNWKQYYAKQVRITRMRKMEQREERIVKQAIKQGG